METILSPLSSQYMIQAKVNYFWLLKQVRV